MSRPERDHWNWREITVNNKPGYWKNHCMIEDMLRQTAYNKDGWEIRVTTEFSKPRKYGASKVITKYHYYVRDDSTAMWLMLHI